MPVSTRQAVGEDLSHFYKTPCSAEPLARHSETHGLGQTHVTSRPEVPSTWAAARLAAGDISARHPPAPMPAAKDRRVRPDVCGQRGVSPTLKAESCCRGRSWPRVWGRGSTLRDGGMRSSQAESGPLGGPRHHEKSAHPGGRRFRTPLRLQLSWRDGWGRGKQRTASVEEKLLEDCVTFLEHGFPKCSSSSIISHPRSCAPSPAHKHNLWSKAPGFMITQGCPNEHRGSRKLLRWTERAEAAVSESASSLAGDGTGTGSHKRKGPTRRGSHPFLPEHF